MHAIDDITEAGAVAASHVASALRSRLAEAGSARIVFAAAPSQDAVLHALSGEPDIDWSRVTAFQMDEYLGLTEEHSQAFHAYLDERIYSLVRPGHVHAMRPGRDGASEAGRYAALLKAAPIDVVCLGIGENGHIAFNDPGVADFDDPLTVKVVELDEASRQQQVNDGCFPSLDDVPRRALTLTVPALVTAATLVGCVSGARKRTAVHRALFGPISTDCPASILRQHPGAHLFLDGAAAPPGY